MLHTRLTNDLACHAIVLTQGLKSRTRGDTSNIWLVEAQFHELSWSLSVFGTASARHTIILQKAHLRLLLRFFLWWDQTLMTFDARGDDSLSLPVIQPMLNTHVKAYWVALYATTLQFSVHMFPNACW